MSEAQQVTIYFKGVSFFPHVTKIFFCLISDFLKFFFLGNLFSLVDCIPLLQKMLKDESSVTCKLACTAVRVSRSGNVVIWVSFVDWDPAMLRCINMEQKLLLPQELSCRKLCFKHGNGGTNSWKRIMFIRLHSSII